MSSLPEYERDLIRKRPNGGLQSALARGRTGGRRRGILKKKFLSFYVILYKDVTKRPEKTNKPFGLTRATFYWYATI